MWADLNKSYQNNLFSTQEEEQVNKDRHVYVTVCTQTFDGVSRKTQSQHSI